MTPLTHGCAMVATMSALWAGASVSCQPQFRLRQFWDDVRVNSPTYLFALYPIAALLMTLPPSPSERESTLGLGYIVGAADQGTASCGRRGSDSRSSTATALPRC